MGSTWIPLDKIQYLIQYESFIVAGTFIILGYVFYTLFLKTISEKRHKNLQHRFKIASVTFLVTLFLSFCHWTIFQSLESRYFLIKIGSYLSLITLFLGTYLLIKIAQIGIYLYLFWANMSHGVPRLLANMFTLVFSILISGLLASNVFGFHLSAVLASSAIFSIILGLALQDTLGNLFSGFALQIDRPFSIGDWIEIHTESKKYVGQVTEITWRATYLLGHSDEQILVPNKTLGQCEITIFSNLTKPPRFQQTFRFKYNDNITQIKSLILNYLKLHPKILQENPPRALITETEESFLILKIFYSLNDYGEKFRVGDEIIEELLKIFQSHGIQTARPMLEVHQNSLNALES